MQVRGQHRRIRLSLCEKKSYASSPRDCDTTPSRGVVQFSSGLHDMARIQKSGIPPLLNNCQKDKGHAANPGECIKVHRSLP